MGSILAKLVGGPYGGEFFSVDEDQDEIGGLGNMARVPPNEHTDDDGRTIVTPGEWLEKYVKQPDTMRPLTEEETPRLETVGSREGVTALAFAGHDVDRVCDFTYVAP